MKTIVTFCFICVAALAAAADKIEFPSLTTTKGVVYQHVKVTKHDALEIRFTHDGGVATVPLSDLPKDKQDLFGYDPVAANFQMIAKQEERRNQLIADEQRKAKQAETAAKQQSEVKEIKAIEAKGKRLLIICREVLPAYAKCEVQGLRLVEHKGKAANGKKTATRKTMSGEAEMVEEAFSISEDQFNPYVAVRILGVGQDKQGKAWNATAYECEWDDKGRAIAYALDAGVAYSTIKKRLTQ